MDYGSSLVQARTSQLDYASRIPEIVTSGIGRFRAGFNCCQSTLLALAEGLHLTDGAMLPILSALSSGFGGGIGRSGGICGAATGCAMALGLILRQGNLEGKDLKEKASSFTLSFLRRFEAECGSLTCIGITGFAHDTPEAQARFSQEGIKESKCVPVVRRAMEIVLEMYPLLISRK